MQIYIKNNIWIIEYDNIALGAPPEGIKIYEKLFSFAILNNSPPEQIQKIVLFLTSASFKADKEFMLSVLNDFIFEDEFVHHILEEEMYLWLLKNF